MDFEYLKKLALDTAREAGIEDIEIYYSASEEISVETVGGKQSSFSTAESSGICVRVTSGGRLGYAASQVMTEDEMKRLVIRAKENAAVTEKEDTVGIYSGGEEYEAVGNGAISVSGAEELKSSALGLSECLFAASPLVREGSATSAFSARMTVRLANSRGVDCCAVGGVSALSAEAVVEKDGSYENAYDTQRLSGELDPNEMAARLVAVAEKKIGAKSVPSGKYDIIIDGKRMRSLLSAFSSVFSAKNAQMGLSLLAGKEGQTVASEVLTLTDDPAREGASLKTCFDAEGVPAKRKAVIEKGVLKTLLHNRETALKAGIKTTANASKAGYAAPISVSPYALCIEAGEYSSEELVALLGEGLLVTEIKGLHAGVNAISGDFSLEAAGFAVREGRVCEAVRSFTVAGNFFELLHSVSALANEVQLGISGSFTTFGAPDTLIKGVSVAGE